MQLECIARDSGVSGACSRAVGAVRGWWGRLEDEGGDRMAAGQMNGDGANEWRRGGSRAMFAAQECRARLMGGGADSRAVAASEVSGGWEDPATLASSSRNELGQTGR